MRIGVPKEIKNNEYRVGLTPAGVQAFILEGHPVFLQKGAGLGSGHTDEAYQKVGAQLLPTIEAVYESAEMIVKVKEPLEIEYPLIRPDQIIYTFFHFAASVSLTQAMMARKAICVAYETVEAPDGSLPLLTPMSEVAGRMATQQGAKYLEKPQQGAGILLGGVPGVAPAQVLVLGGGVVGTQAAKMAAGLGAQVTIFDINLNRLRVLDDLMPANVQTRFANAYNLEQALPKAHLIIGAVLVPGAKAPKLITKSMLSSLQKGTVLVDVAVDQGGCFETTHPTTHKDPTYMIEGILHYSVANMPGAVPQTSTAALTNATLKHGLDLANLGWKKAGQLHAGLQKGFNIVQGKVVNKAVAEAFDLPYTPIQSVF